MHRRKSYSDMLHPVLAPAPVIALLTWGSLIGRRSLTLSRRSVAVFVLAAALGLVAGSDWPGVNADTSLLLLGWVAAGGTLAAWRLPGPVLLLPAGAVRVPGFLQWAWPREGTCAIVVAAEASTWMWAAGLT